MKLQNKSDKRKKLIIIIAAVVAVLALIVGVVCFIVFSNEQPQIETGIDKIILSSTPNKTGYFIGETFEPAGTKIQVIMKNDDNFYFIEHSELTFSGFDSTTVGEKVITVTYRGFTTSFKITVSERPSDTPYVTDIEISNFQDSYSKDFWNEYGPQVAGASIKLIYSDESTQEGIWLQSDWISGYEKVSSTGTTTITIKYDTGAKIIEKVVTITITN